VSEPAGRRQWDEKNAARIAEELVVCVKKAPPYVQNLLIILR
jgi:hypothetical protein